MRLAHGFPTGNYTDGAAHAIGTLDTTDGE